MVENLLTEQVSSLSTLLKELKTEIQTIAEGQIQLGISLRQEMQEFRGSLRQEMKEFRTELKEEIRITQMALKATREDLKQDIAEVKKDTIEIKQKMNHIDLRLSEEILDIKKVVFSN